MLHFPTFRLEARFEDTNAVGVRTLAYYGGHLGQYLVIDPAGRMFITGERRAPQGPKEDEEDVGIAEENPTDGGNDSVAIKPPPENASIAEAKPVAISIAGEGGVASAQPVGQAIVGPGGLAISRPVGTAIAGVPGAENLVLRPEKGPGRQTTGYVYSVYHPQLVQPIVYHPQMSHPLIQLPNYYF
ncbi:hypothetical protein GE061_012822 [Apolygus lucorum]|uniref:Uncharacterized protein n=1 Tax=Apolygus lucorum TaxID=248454 RepID=A0A6A4JZ00_APOLU|nr:hypothetical protein GE061_012822 [Apolygus lucorum]